MASTAANPPPLAQPAICRHAPEVGAVCGKSARTDLCGGREVTRVPTATKRRRECVRLRWSSIWAAYEQVGSSEQLQGSSQNRRIRLRNSSQTIATDK